MIEIILFIIGILLGIWWYSVIILPLFYGIPRSIYYVRKGLLKKSAISFYLKTFLLWVGIWFGASFLLAKYFPNLTNSLLESGGFAIGQLIGIGLMMWRVFTKEGRKDLNADFWDIMFSSRYFNTNHPKFKEIFALTLTNLFVQKFGEQAEEKLNEFLKELLKGKEKPMNNNLYTFAKELAKYSTSAERSNDLVCNIEKILDRKLNEEEKLKLRMDIEIFISLIAIYTVSCLNIDENKKSEFLSQYGENTKKIFQIFGDWSPERIKDHQGLLNVACELYYKNLKGKITPTQKDYENLWRDFADIIITNLNFGPQITSENQKQYNLLSKIIILKLASLHHDVKKKIQENIGLFIENLTENKNNIRREIARKTANYAEANVYALDNPYLNKDEKLEVEMWYQLPGDVMIHTFFVIAILSVFYGFSWKYIIGIPIVVNIVVGIINLFFYNKRVVYSLYLTVLHSWVLYLAGFGTAAFLFFKGSYILAIIALLAPFGIFAFAEPHLFFYSILARKYQMHPKYAFFKREYNYTFPFEEKNKGDGDKNFQRNSNKI